MGMLNNFRKKRAAKTHSASKELCDLYSRLGYKQLPATPSESECKRILAEYKSFPASLVGKNNMNENCDGFLRGHIVMLWWLSNPRTKKNSIPQYFLYEYGLDFEAEKTFLLKCGYLTDEGITEKGQVILKKFDSVVLDHRTKKYYSSDGTITYLREDLGISEEQKNISDAFLQNMKEHKKDLLSLGLNDLAKRQDRYIHDYEVGENQHKKSRNAEKLSKNGLINESNQILESLISSKEPLQGSVIVYERLAKNYRKQKRYKDEIEICIKFLKEEQPRYGGSMHVDTFKKRIAFAEKKLN